MNKYRCVLPNFYVSGKFNFFSFVLLLKLYLNLGNFAIQLIQ